MSQNSKKRDVKITVHSIQHDVSDEVSKNSYQGDCHYMAGKHIVRYEEVFETEEGSTEKSDNLVKIGDDFVQIRKKGAVSTQMHFEVAKEHHAPYQTPFGVFDMTILTDALQVQKTDKDMTIHIQYQLSLNQCPISHCTINMKIEYC